MTRYSFTRSAARDLDDIWMHVAADSVTAAERVITKIEARIRSLATNPKTGHFREDLADRRYRFAAVYSYLIVYRWEARPIRIIRILHAARDVRVLLNL